MGTLSLGGRRTNINKVKYTFWGTEGQSAQLSSSSSSSLLSSWSPLGWSSGPPVTIKPTLCNSASGQEVCLPDRISTGFESGKLQNRASGGLRLAGGTNFCFFRLESGRNPARKPDFRPGPPDPPFYAGRLCPQTSLVPQPLYFGPATQASPFSGGCRSPDPPLYSGWLLPPAPPVYAGGGEETIGPGSVAIWAQGSEIACRPIASHGPQPCSARHRLPESNVRAPF